MDRARILVDALTVIHGLGALVVWGMGIYVAVAPGNAEDLAVTPGGKQLVEWTGAWLPAFFALLGAFLASLAWGSHRRRAWSWPAAVIAYGIGVVGSAWEIAIGIDRYWASLAVNGAVVVLLLLPSVREAFGRRPT